MTTQSRMTNFVKSGEHVEYFSVDVSVSLANTAATSDTVTKGPDYVVVTVEQPEFASPKLEPLTSEDDPVLAQLWDNDEDDIFDAD